MQRYCTRWRETADVDADAKDAGPGAGMAGTVTAAELEDALFNAVRGHLEEMITWGRGDEALGMEHFELEEKTLADGFEVMRLFTEAHMAVRAARETRRDDVADADGDARVTVQELSLIHI